ncbi:MAG: hypothetical protein ABH814_03575 [bacterium]
MSKKSDAEMKARFEEMSLPELAQNISGLEGFAWRLEHDAADGRIEHSIDDDTAALRNMARTIAVVFARKANLDVSDMEAMRKRIRQELAKFDALLAARWKQIFRVGAVFSITGQYGYLTDDCDDFFEVLGVYDSTMVGPNQHVLTRIRGTGSFALFDERQVVDLRIEKKRPKYKRNKGFLRAGRYAEFPPVRYSGKDIRDTGAVFRYSGGSGDPRNGVWETFHSYLLAPGTSYHVVIARCQSRGQVAEFSAADLSRIEITNLPRRFIKKDGNCTSVPELKI